MKPASIAAVVAVTLGAAAALLAAPIVAMAHGEQHRGMMAPGARPISDEEHGFGRQGDPARASRTIAIDMSDAMRFSPADISVKQGETIRFVVRNRGKVMHEMVLGTMAELKEHGELMKKFPNMEHDEPYMAHVAPGRSEEITWTFSAPGEYRFGCLEPGHLDAGMIGRVVVSAR